MSTLETQDDAARQRIINHMNADHSDSIRRYLEAFNHKSFYQVRNARMTDVTLNDMKFDCGGQQISIPFDPPMKSYREARDRVVQLDKEALHILGRSDITITKFIPPWVHLFHLYNFSQCLMTYIIFSRPAHFQPGSLPYDLFLVHFPKFNGFCASIRLLLLGIMIPIHITEAVFMARKLGRHGVTPFDGIWWAWVASCVVEGKTSFMRADAFLEEKRKEKEAKKH
ncbi:integral membrane protein-like protein [Massarina eburnea CBS 473.64]|uniref:Integral membrane protein-like protein n=1 Tax=Massarina eburnea CBS 473.64 TaxID=1395130 RepID=A0A6A6RWM1_9PLEO|nr:integral membrane protein-like protein [Massarina eburnea CBS 473.64]